jgi:hypothetical protein
MSAVIPFAVVGKHPEHRRRSPSRSLYSCHVLFEQRDKPLRCVDGAGCRRGDAIEEEVEPRFPLAAVSHAIEQPVVIVAVLLEIQAQVEQRLLQHSGVMQQKRDQQPPDTTVSVQERVDRFELHVSQRSRYEHGILRARLVKGALERRHQLIDQRRRRRYEVRVPRPGPADPVLRSSELAGLLLASAPAGEQLFVHLANEAVREREAVAESSHPMLQRGDIEEHRVS